MSGPETLRAGVVGWPISHSLSPLMHATWAERAGVKAVYEAIPVEPGFAAFADAARRLEREGYEGINVTLPHKENALRYALERSGAVSETASAAGAANLLIFGKDGLCAHNTDVEGFSAALLGTLAAPERRHRALVLGGGGAARAVVLALSGLGFREIEIANRTHARAAEIAERFGASAVEWNEIGQRLAGADVFVNATSLGMKDAPPLELSLDGLPAHAAVADIVYTPLDTPLLKRARQRGLRTADGLSMLIGQGVPAFRALFGADAEADAGLRARLENALAGRDRA